MTNTNISDDNNYYWYLLLLLFFFLLLLLMVSCRQRGHQLLMPGTELPGIDQDIYHYW